MISGIDTIYYRGAIRSCNYKCGYCPFSKVPFSQCLIEKDSIYLSKFIDYVKRSENLRTIMIIPYGEAIIHSHYVQAVMQLSKIDFLETICLQTNLSFDIDNFANKMIDQNGNLNKLSFWCTFHPSQTTASEFLIQCKKLLFYGISFSVGTVGDFKQIGEIRKLRKGLPITIYMWVNALKGFSKKYSKSQVAELKKIDPFFELEINNLDCDTTKCDAGRKSIFVNYKGDIKYCNLCKNTYGNLYTEKFHYMEAIASKCDCYLSYSRRTDLKELAFFGQNKAPRILKKEIKAIFFDIDGTLTNQHGVISDSVLKGLEEISKKTMIILCTSLPYSYVTKKYKKLMGYVSGGIYSNGAYIKHGAFEKVNPISESTIKHLKGLRIKPVIENNFICKFIFSNTNENIKLIKDNLTNSLDKIESSINIIYESPISSITDINATKLNGVLELSEFLNFDVHNVIVVGNSENDMELLSYFNLSIAISNCEKIKSCASYFGNILNILNIILKLII